MKSRLFTLNQFVCWLFLIIPVSMQAQDIYAILSPFVSLNNLPVQDGSYTAELEDFVHWYSDAPLINLGFDLSFEEWELVLLIEGRQNLSDFLLGKALHNLSPSFDSELALAGYIARKGEPFSWSFGRRKLKMGPGEYSLHLSDTAPGFDHILMQLQFPKTYGKWSWNWLAISSDKTYAPSNTPWPIVEPESGFPFSYRTYIVHSLAFTGSAFRVSVSDINFIYGTTPDLQDFAVLVPFHGLFQKHQNMMFSLSAEGIAGPFRIYGELCMDDIRSSLEGAATNPTALGFLFGAEVTLFADEPYAHQDPLIVHTWREESLEKSGGLRLRFEHYWNSAWMYNRYDPDGKITYTWRVNALGMDEATQIAEFFYGFPYGPDSILEKITLLYEKEDFTSTFYLQLLGQGENDIDSLYDNSNPFWATTNWLGPNGYISWVPGLGFSGEYRLREWLTPFSKGYLHFEQPVVSYSLTVGCRFFLGI